MTLEFLKLFVQTYPNNYELGEIIRKFHFLYEKNKLNLNIKEIEQLFIEKYINKVLHFQKS